MSPSASGLVSEICRSLINKEVIICVTHAALSCYLVAIIQRLHDLPYRTSRPRMEEEKTGVFKRSDNIYIHMNTHEEKISAAVIDPDQIKVKFDSIGGLSNTKQAIYEQVILPLRRPELFSQGKLLKPNRGMLLYGPPGTGKTMLAKAIAKESGAVFLNVGLHNVIDKWIGETEKHVAAIFSLAHKLQPAVIFIDEIDSFLGERLQMEHEISIRAKTMFMSLWDGLTTDYDARVMVLGATNRPGVLDQAILGRFPHAFEIGLPDHSERIKILEVILKDENIEDEINLDHLSSLSEGYSGADLTDVCKKAAYFPIRDFLDAEEKDDKQSHVRPLSQLDIEKAIASSRTIIAATQYGKQDQGGGRKIRS